MPRSEIMPYVQAFNWTKSKAEKQKQLGLIKQTVDETPLGWVAYRRPVYINPARWSSGNYWQNQSDMLHEVTADNSGGLTDALTFHTPEGYPLASYMVEFKTKWRLRCKLHRRIADDTRVML